MRKAILFVCMMLAFTPLLCGCDDDDEWEDSETTTYLISGADYIDTNESVVYKVEGSLPSGYGVNWSVNSSDFTLTTVSYNSVLVSARSAGKSATLTASIVDGEKVVHTLTKKIQSQ